MTEKEIAEIKKRFKSDKSNITKVRGCYVNTAGEKISTFTQSLATMSQEEVEEILAIVKKTLSGSVGKNLIDIEFSNSQVLEGDEHKLLMDLRNSSLKDDVAIEKFFDSVISSVSIEGGYLIILISDKYDVPSYSKAGQQEEDSANVYSYIVCAICPVKLTKSALSYKADESIFQRLSVNSFIAQPEIGFLFPSFDDRASNLYNALYYTKNTSQNYDEFVDAIFKSELPMPAKSQKETFSYLLNDTISQDSNLEVTQIVHEKLSEYVQLQKEQKGEKPLTVGKEEIKNVLKYSGVGDTYIENFDKRYNDEFGQDTKIPPQNIVDVKKFEVKTADVKIQVKPERTELIKTKVIDGVKYILIRADDNVEVNGVNITIKE